MMKFKNVVLIIFLVLIFGFVFSIFSLKLGIFGYNGYVIVSGSMKPNINIGDYVIVKKTNISNIKVNDVISYKNNNSIVTHRVNTINKDINKKNISIITKGDNNNIEDDVIINDSNIVGKVVYKLKGIGKVLLVIQNNFILILIFIVGSYFILNR